MKKSRICAVITHDNTAAIGRAANAADFFEVRIDLVGRRWPQIAGGLNKPWIATNRNTAQRGGWKGSERKRIDELLRAVDLGAWMVDIEMDSPALPEILDKSKGKARCMVSYHDWDGTPPLAGLVEKAGACLDTGAYACKVVTTARSLNDNLTVLKLLGRFPSKRLVAFAMGGEGVLSRVLAPLAGSWFTYASIDGTTASAPGQVTAQTMRKIYGLIK